MNWEQLTKAILEEAKTMRHNASLLGCREKWNRETLESFLSYWFAKTNNNLQARFGKTHLGITLQLQQYGHAAATIAPFNFWIENAVYTGFNESIVCGLDYSRDGLEGYNYDCKTLAIMRWVNKQVALGKQEFLNLFH